MRMPQICLGFPYNWHVLDTIVRHNRPRKEKMRFVDKYGGDCVSTHSGGSGQFFGENFSFAPQICGDNMSFRVVFKACFRLYMDTKTTKFILNLAVVTTEFMLNLAV